MGKQQRLNYYARRDADTNTWYVEDADGNVMASGFANRMDAQRYIAAQMVARRHLGGK